MGTVRRNQDVTHKSKAARSLARSLVALAACLSQSKAHKRIMSRGKWGSFLDSIEEGKYGWSLVNNEDISLSANFCMIRSYNLQIKCWGGKYMYTNASEPISGCKSKMGNSTEKTVIQDSIHSLFSFGSLLAQFSEPWAPYLSRGCKKAITDC